MMPQLHMPLQSGSDRVLKAMRRSCRSERFLGILDRVRDRIPNAAITTDIIVGFPGETEEDFQETLRVVEQARFALGLHLPVLDPPRHARGDHGGPTSESASCRSSSSGSRRCRTGSRSRRTSG